MANDTATGMIYAGFWRRYLALMLDYVVLAILTVLFGVAIKAFVESPESAEGLRGIASLLLAWVYFASMESSEDQATYGKQAMGIKVTDAQGNRISFARASGRVFGKILSGLIFLIGYIMAAFTTRKQALHDLMTDCVVVHKSAPSTLAMIFAILIGFTPILGILAAVALPAYQDYTVRARVYEAIAVGQKATKAVDSYVAEHNMRPDSTQTATPESEYVESIAIDRQGAVRVALKIPPIEQGVIIFSAQEEGWACSAENVDERYLPRECR
jgi:uncharacterized RDD family membrane protein YckC/Tfp pilus assembly major pilin PilA